MLLGTEFRAKIADFGLARIKVTASAEADPLSTPDDGFSQDLGIFPSQELYSSVSPEFEFATRVGGNNSGRDFEGRVRCNPIASLDDVNEMRAKGKEAAMVPLDDEGFSVENSKELNDGDWWWKQEGSGELNSRDYVREWIGSQISPLSNSDWENGERMSDLEETQAVKTGGVDEKKNNSERKHADSGSKKSESAKEWWKEEYFAEMSKKSKCNRGLNLFRKSNSSSHAHSSNNNIDRELNAPDVSFRKGGWRRKRKRSKSVGSEMFSGDLFSRELSSTATSMRGTICYVAPEHGGCRQFMEKADIYSFGVLILVIVSGRRPLHVLSSPMKLERANLISWCRQLASSGNVLDLVDERLRDSFDKEQANLCINLALLCLQKLPELRPDSEEIIKILKGEMDLPVVPFEFSPSPKSKMLNKSRRKSTHDRE